MIKYTKNIAFGSSKTGQKEEGPHKLFKWAACSPRAAYWDTPGLEYYNNY